MFITSYLLAGKQVQGLLWKSLYCWVYCGIARFVPNFLVIRLILALKTNKIMVFLLHWEKNVMLYIANA